MQIEDEKDTELTNKKIFELLDARFSRKYILYEHLHNSYNKLVDSIINYYYTNDNIFDENRVGEVVYRYKFKYEDIYVRPPLNENGDALMYPSEARDKSTTYTIKFVGKITQIQEIYDLNTKSIISVKEIGTPVERETILSIPCMVRSKYCSLQINRDYNRKECEYDPGGYFIVNGSEKYVLSLEKMVENKPLVFVKKDAGIESYKVKVNSRSPNPNIMMQGIEINMEKNYEINIKVPIINEVSVFVLMRALGLETDREIVKYIVYDENDIDMLNLLKISIDLSKKEGKKLILNKEDAYYSLTNKVRVVKKYAEKDRKLQYDEKKEHLEALLRNAFLPHINSDHYDDVLRVKAYFLGYMVNKLLNCYLGRAEPDDRDSFVNKRIDMPGDLTFELFKQYYKKMLNDCNKFFKKRNSGNHETPLNIINQIKPGNIEQGIKSAMMTGNWLKKKGVAQMYPRLTFLQSLSFLRRVDAPSGDSSTMKLTGPRHYHPSQVGFLCCVESPEHSNIGLVKHMGLLSSICVGSNEQAEMIYNILISNKNFIHINNHSSTQLVSNIKVFLNGEWVGMTDKPYELYSEIRKLKQNGVIIRTNSIIYDIPKGEIKIYTDSGRLYRPLLNVKDNKIVLTDKIINEVLGDKSLKGLNKWDALIEKYPEAIDFVDMEEQYYMLVSEYKSNVEEMKKRESNVFEDSNKPIINRYDNSMIINYTHSEFHPTTVIGIIAGNIPFANHNQGPRNIFQYAQGRQAMSIYSSNYRDRLDISYILYNVQKALVNTRIAKYVHTDILPCGEQAVVAIACYTGHNQDDSIVFNQSSIDRGLFRSISLKKYISKVGKNQSTSQDDIFMKPDITKLTGTRHAVYDKLNDKGYVPEETYIENGDVIIGKVTPIQPAPGSNKCFKDSSEIYKSAESAIIDKVFTGIYDSEGNEMIKIRTRSERIPKIGDKYCFPASINTEVLTSKGWKLIQQITKDDLVASLVNDKYLQYVNPIDTYKFNYDGDIYKLRSQMVDLDVTIDHELYVKRRDKNNFELISAKNVIGKRVNFKKNCINNNQPIQYFTGIKDKSINMDIWLKYFGIWYAEGWANTYNNYNYQTTICQCKPTVQQAIINIINQMGYTYSIHDNNSKITISNKELCEYLSKLSVGALEKSLPDWVWNLSQEQSIILLEHMILGDGTTKPSGSVCYYTSSSKLADDVMKLAIHCGWSGSIKLIREAGYETEINGRKITSRADSLCVGINKTKNEPQINHGHIHEQNGQSEELYNYTGEVYCLEVPSHVFMIRQNNKNVWIGNCSRHGLTYF
jgi:DNA-directed RNA polymerase II subunit RPB2